MAGTHPDADRWDRGRRSGVRAPGARSAPARAVGCAGVAMGRLRPKDGHRPHRRGPGPSIFYADTPFFQRLARDAVVAFWDQRATGNSRGATTESLTLAQYVEDLDAVVRVIQSRLETPRLVFLDGMATVANLDRSNAEKFKDGTPLCEADFTDLTHVLPSITVPSLVVWGRDDPVIPLEQGEEAFRLLGTLREKKELVVIENAGHNSPYERPDAVADAIQSFVARVLQ